MMARKSSLSMSKAEWLDRPRLDGGHRGALPSAAWGFAAAVGATSVQERKGESTVMLTSAIQGFLIACTTMAGAGPGDPEEERPVLAGADAAEPSTAIAAEGTSTGNAWTFSITPYLWMYGMDGDVRIRNTEADFDVSFGDILENLDLAFMAHVEAWKGRLGLFVDPSYGRLLTEAEVGPTEVDLETDMILVDFGAFYRVLDQRTEQGLARTADVSLGGRYLYLKNEIDFSMAADRDRSNDFVDLTVGGRYGMDVTERIGLLVGGDIGGFELGSSSEFAWNAQALGSYRIGESGRLWAGYRILDFDRDEGGSSGFDVQFSGPIVGYEFRL